MSSHKSGQMLISNDAAPYHYYSQINEKQNRWLIYLNITSMLCAVAIVLLAIQRDGSAQIQGPTKSQTEMPEKNQLEQEMKSLPPHVHLSLKPSVENGQGGRCLKEDHVLLHFDSNNLDPAIESIRGVAAMQDAIHINHSGLYRVYVSIQFKETCNITQLDTTDNSWPSYVYQESAKILLNIPYPGPGRTTYNDGYFYLKAGDRFQVCVSNKEMILFDPTTTFLGFYAEQLESTQSRGGGQPW